MLLELELPRVLAPDLSSNCYSVWGLKGPHSNWPPLKGGHWYVPLRPQGFPIGNVARLLPSLEVVAISQATSPGPNPDPLYPL